MQNAMQGRTTILLSSQERLISQCDRIFVVGDQGTVVEQGTFSELESDPNSHFNRLRRSM